MLHNTKRKYSEVPLNSNCITEHLAQNNLVDAMQSAYHSLHSTETLLKVRNNVLSTLNGGSVVILLILDLSAAFDTIDHQILLSRRHNMYSIRGDVHSWFKS